MDPIQSTTLSDGASQCPMLFIGHGTPLNALADNVFTQAWRQLGRSIGRPRAILMISAHWYTADVRVTAMPYPDTLYDFGYQNMFHITYPAPGDPALAERIAGLLEPIPVARDMDWGFDHGTWAVLTKAFPSADIPVIQLSIDASKPAAFHYQLGRRLAPLRREGILIVGSGNIVHNLPLTIRSGVARPYPWAERFDAQVRDKLLARDWQALVDYPSLDAEAKLAVPTPEHYLPLLYTLGAADVDEPLSFPVEGIDRGSMSMRSIVFGHMPDDPGGREQ
jgi:4,5-DOPA dioxygenase extradiol